MSIPTVKLEGDNIVIDGKTYTPAQAAVVTNAVVSDGDKLWKVLTNRKNWNIKQIEKGVLYLAALVGATNGFSQLSIPSNVREAIVFGSAAVVSLIHISTPTNTVP